MNATSDVVVVGGGIIGLAIATEIRQRGATVTVLSRHWQDAATQAAAGMLAPQAEGIAPGPMLELCLRSRMLYPDWVHHLERITGDVTGYWPCGILAPVYEHPVGESQPNPAISSSPRPSRSSHSTVFPLNSRENGDGGDRPTDGPFPSQTSLATAGHWLDRSAIHAYQTGLGAEVSGGWWFPEDAQVDNRALSRTLLAAAQTLGVEIRQGVTVEGLHQRNQEVVGLQTTAGDWHAGQYVLANGAWANGLVPLPVYPVKGQMAAVRVPVQKLGDLPLQRVLFGPGSYIVPRRDGRIVIGATSETVGFRPHNTPAGVQTLLQQAIRLFSALQDFPLEATWWGFRPATPDQEPILGLGHCRNLFLATGHYRNGILLAPITARLIADLMTRQQADPLLAHFSWERFHRPSPRRTPMNGTAINGTAINGTASPEPMALRQLPAHASVKPIQWMKSMPVLEKSPELSPIPPLGDRPLVIAGRSFQSRLMTGTGKYRTMEEMGQSVAASGCEIVTVAVRRVQTRAPGHEGLAEALDWSKIWMLPNTAGCQTAEDAVRVARLGREMAKLLGQEDNNFIKLEVIPDSQYLLPDPIGTLEAAEQLVKEGFAVLPYINADPMLAKRLEDVGCATVMPLGSPIGSGQGLKTLANVQIIIENAQIPVVVDAGIGAPSEAAQAMELGADAVLINTAIAQAQNPVAMAKAMGLGVEAGRLAYLAGRIPVKRHASASSPLTGMVTQEVS